MKIIPSEQGFQTPIADTPRMASGTRDVFSEDWWGAFSIETFCDQGALVYTHDDAQGWLNYLTKFHPANFWFQDANVRPWAYYEDFDNWQDTYGMDAVMAVYHSGHGGMDNNGVFYLPMGSSWGNEGCTVVSNRMRLGNEQTRYIFLSTCESLRVLNGHTPIRTWQPANLGFRMLFGFETISYDNPNYGKFFWEEWNKNKSLSQAWLDASWRISNRQAPSVVACGQDQADAQNRLYNERLLYWDGVSTNWWSWRWYYAASALREPNRSLPQEFLTAELRPVGEPRLQAIVDRYQLDLLLPNEVMATPTGEFSISDGGLQLSVGRQGAHEVQMARPNLANRERLPVSQVRAIAQAAVHRYGLTQETDLMLDCFRQEAMASGSNAGSGHLEEPQITETTVQFRQVINGLPVLSPEAGTVRISVDNDGTVTRIQDSTRAIARLSNRPKNTVAMPQTNGAIARPRTDSSNPEQLLSQEWSKQMANWAVRGRMPLHSTTVPGSTEVGYEIRGNDAVLVAQKSVEVDFGNGYRKLYRVVTPILE
jgi:hypothetical protein